LNPPRDHIAARKRQRLIKRLLAGQLPLGQEHADEPLELDLPLFAFKLELEELLLDPGRHSRDRFHLPLAIHEGDVLRFGGDFEILGLFYF
jgi:hypothetical protein